MHTLTMKGRNLSSRDHNHIKCTRYNLGKFKGLNACLRLSWVNLPFVFNNTETRNELSYTREQSQCPLSRCGMSSTLQATTQNMCFSHNAIRTHSMQQRMLTSLTHAIIQRNKTMYNNTCVASFTSNKTKSIKNTLTNVHPQLDLIIHLTYQDTLAIHL